MRLAYVLGFALLLSAFAATRPAKADDVFYVPLTTAERLEAAEQRIAALEAAISKLQPAKSEAKKPAPKKSAPAAKKTAPQKPPPPQATGDPTCACNSARTQCGCLTKYPACPCAKPARGVPAARPFLTVPSYDPDHTCDRCGTAQYVISGRGPRPGTHTHSCARCGNVWWH